MDCCICYEVVEDPSSILLMKCCNNSKQICCDCLNCLRTPLCPYCRTPLPSELLQHNKNISDSLPSSYPNISTNSDWNSFLNQEHIINPYLYDDSRRLRRQIRRLRYEYLQSQTRNNPFRLTSRERREIRRQNRQSMRQQLREYQNEYNNTYDLQDMIQHQDYHDDELGFELEM